MKNVKMSSSAKKEFTAIVSVLMVAVFIVIAGAVRLSSVTKTTGSYTNSIAFGGQSVLEDELGTYINNYFVKNGVTEYMTEEEQLQLIAEITSGVINSLPASTLTEENMNTIRSLVSTSVESLIAEYNLDKEETLESSVITPEFESYINETVIPNVTAQLQLYNDDTDDLKESLEELSAEYTANKSEYDKLINSISTKLKSFDETGATEEEISEIKAELETLSAVLDNYKSLQSAQTTSYEAEIALLQGEIDNLTDSVEYLTNLTEAQLDELKETLTAQIEANTDLSAAQKAELEIAIEALGADNAKSLDDAKTYLQNYADHVSTTLSAAINHLTLTNADTLNETKTQLLNQITANEELSDSQKEMLNDLINGLDESTGASIDTVQAYLSEQLGVQTVNLNAAVSDLQGAIDVLASRMSTVEGQIAELTETTLAELKTNLQAQITANANLTEAQKAELMEKINALEASTMSELSAQVVSLQEEIAGEAAANSQALSAAITALYGGADGSTTINDLLSQIEENADLTEAQKTELEGLITEKYNSLDESIQINVSSLQTDLTNEVAARNAAINTAVNDLQTTLAGTISTLSDTVNANREALEAADANLQEQIDTLNSSYTNSLNGVILSYQDGHFYATSEDGTVKKLDYAE